MARKISPKDPNARTSQTNKKKYDRKKVKEQTNDQRNSR